MANKAITVQDVDLVIDMDTMTDIEVYDLLYKVNGGNPMPLMRLMREIIVEGMDAAMEHLRGENGRVSVFDAAPFLNELFQAANLGE